MPRQNKMKNIDFTNFWLQYHEEQNEKGLTITMDQAKAQALPIWASMLPCHRAEYKTGCNQDELDSLVEQRRMKEKSYKIMKEEKQKDNEMKAMQRVDEILERDDENHEWHMLSVTYFVKTADKVFPAELAIAKMSMKQGIIDTLHMFINPGDLPFGSGTEAIFAADETHKLPLPSNCIEGSEDDMEKVSEKLQTFIGKDTKVLFMDAGAKDDNLAAARLTLEVIYGASNDIEKPFVCSLEKFFFEMQGKAAKKNKTKKFKTIEEAGDALKEKVERFYYSACEYHSSKDSAAFCCLTHVSTWCQLILDNCLSVEHTTEQVQDQADDEDNLDGSDSTLKDYEQADMTYPTYFDPTNPFAVKLSTENKEDLCSNDKEGKEDKEYQISNASQPEVKFSKLNFFDMFN